MLYSPQFFFFEQNDLFRYYDADKPWRMAKMPQSKPKFPVDEEMPKMLQFKPKTPVEEEMPKLLPFEQNSPAT